MLGRTDVEVPRHQQRQDSFQAVECLDDDVVSLAIDRIILLRSHALRHNTLGLTAVQLAQLLSLKVAYRFEYIDIFQNVSIVVSTGQKGNTSVAASSPLVRVQVAL